MIAAFLADRITVTNCRFSGVGIHSITPVLSCKGLEKILTIPNLYNFIPRNAGVGCLLRWCMWAGVPSAPGEGAVTAVFLQPAII